MSLVNNQNFDDHYARIIDGKKEEFFLTPEDARFHHHEARAAQPIPAISFETPEVRREPRHRAEVPLRGVIDIANRKF